MPADIPVTFRIPRNLVSGIEGYIYLANLNLKTFNFINRVIIIDFLNNEWFDSSLCSPLGAIMQDLRNRNNRVIIHGIQEMPEDIFRQNGFYRFIDDTQICKPSFLPSIDFKTFKLEDAHIFQQYINDQLLAHSQLPQMSALLKSKVNKSILEIFNNAHLHGASQTVYSSGQYDPREKILKFTLSDMGVTIRKNVNNFFSTGSKISGKASIAWAVEQGNTTKKGKIPGGLGLSLIREFLKLNNGGIQIVSSSGYWEERKGIIFAREITDRFLGTIVNLEFNLSDTHSYSLKSELTSKNVL